MSTLQLAPELTIYTVAELHPQWLAWLGETATPGTESAALDISAVNQVDAAGLQLLLSLKHMAMASGLQLHLLGSSNVLETGLAALGLGGVMGGVMGGMMGRAQVGEPVAAGASA